MASFSLYLTALELDPDPRPPKALRFEPLIGRNLFVADAFKLKDRPETSRLSHMRFDAIVGNPPWTYSGSESKPTWPGQAPALPPRSQDFAFVWRSIELAHETTRFGIVMRATPYFSTADASRRARNQLFNKLAPIALVNLSALRDDLFPTADYPAVVLFARLHNRQNKATIPVISIPWTSAFSRSGAFDISPSDVHFAPNSGNSRPSIRNQGVRARYPARPTLLRRVSGETPSLSEVLEKLGLTIVTGVQLLAGDQNDASHLIGLPLLDFGELELRIESQSLPHFTRRKIHRPRDRAAFRGPLVLLGEGLRDGRVSIGVSEQDVVYTRSFYESHLRERHTVRD